MHGTRLAPLAAGLLIVAGCGGAPPEPSSEGAKLYARLGCARCHGEAREGTRTAPPLHELVGHWQAGELAAYLRNPVEVTAGNPRLKALDQEWVVAMTPAQVGSDAELQTLVEYLLGEP